MTFFIDPSPPRTSVLCVEAEVIGVSPDGYTATVRTRDGRRLDVSVSSPMQLLGRDVDSLKDPGINLGPEEGAHVLITTTSFGNSYITGFIAPRVGASYQGRRRALPRGDLMLHGRGGSFLRVRSSGTTEIGASDLAQTTYSPAEDLIQSICRNFVLSNAGLGNLLWLLDAVTGRGGFRILSRAGVDEGEPSASLSLGDSPWGSLVDLRTTSGKEASVALDRAGNARVDAGKDVTIAAFEGKIRQQGRKIYLNSGAARPQRPMLNNFFEPPAAPAEPGGPRPLMDFPAMAVLPTALPPPDPKRLLNPIKFAQPSSSLPPVVDPPSSAGPPEDLPKLV